MPTNSWDELGPYKVLAQAGAGGMGEVYKAADTRRNRTVAMKVLPAQFSAIKENFSAARSKEENDHSCVYFSFSIVLLRLHNPN